MARYPHGMRMVASAGEVASSAGPKATGAGLSQTSLQQCPYSQSGDYRAREIVVDRVSRRRASRVVTVTVAVGCRTTGGAVGSVQTKSAAVVSLVQYQQAWRVARNLVVWRHQGGWCAL